MSTSTAQAAIDMTNTATKESGLIEHCIERLNKLNDTFANELASIQGSSARIKGVTIETDTQKETPTGPGDIGKLEGSIDRLDALVESLAHAANEIERI